MQVKCARACRRKFLSVFPRGFHDEDYISLERNYKWEAHRRWDSVLGREDFAAKLKAGHYKEIVSDAVRIESRTNLLFSFEKMALRDAVRDAGSARAFATSLFDLLYADDPMELRFRQWVETIDQLPRRQTRVLTWPLATVFGFLARPKEHFFFKPTVTREAARRYGVELPYTSRPSAENYLAILAFAKTVRSDLRDLRPRDMIDIQSFLWVQGSEEYPD